MCIRDRPYLPTTCLQKAAAVSLPLHFIFSPTVPIFSHSFLFPKLLVSRPCRSPSLGQLRDQGPVAAIPACDSPAEGGSREFASLFYFSPHHSDFFSQLLFFQNFSAVGRAGRPPSVSEGNKGPPPPSPARELCGECNEVTVSLPLVSIPPHSKFLLTATFSN